MEEGVPNIQDIYVSVCACMNIFICKVELSARCTTLSLATQDQKKWAMLMIIVCEYKLENLFRPPVVST